MRIEFEDLAKDARVWIYQNNQPIPESKVDAIQQDLQEFINQWSAHQQPLYAYADIMHNRFVVLMVDEHRNAASGCSIDASVNFIRSLERKYELELFNRFTFSYQKEDEIYTVPKAQFAALYRSGEIDQNTMVFDNLIKTKGDLEEAWQKPLGTSWLRRFI